MARNTSWAEKLGTVGVLVMIVAFCLAIAGWVMNLVAIVHAVGAGDSLTVKLLARFVGVVVFPLGIILGWWL